VAPTAVFATKMAQKNRAALSDTCVASVADEKAPRRVSGQHKRSGSKNRRAEDDRQNRVLEHQVLRGLPSCHNRSPITMESAKGAAEFRPDWAASGDGAVPGV